MIGATGTVVVDGGLATELERRGHDLTDRLWSARVLIADPQAIEDVHLAYYQAGAQVTTTASYQASVEGFGAVGIDRDDALALVRRSVELARRARERFSEESRAGADPDEPPLLVAGSVGPYGAMLADGSEYRGDYDPGAATLAAFHRPRIEALAAAGTDLLAFETIPTIREAAVLVDLLDDFDVPAWLSYSCRDDRSTSAGEPIADAIALGEHPRVVAVGVNCTAPRHLPALLAAARAATDLPLIAYPNGGDRWDAETRRWVSDGAGGTYDPLEVATWTGLGAAWLGGCCGTGPDEIAVLGELLGKTAAGTKNADRPGGRSA